jgi:hypothetical protein
VVVVVQVVVQELDLEVATEQVVQETLHQLLHHKEIPVGPRHILTLVEVVEPVAAELLVQHYHLSLGVLEV